MGLVVERVPGERSPHAIVAANAGPCCCCCCCCLHSLGGMIGGLTARAPVPEVVEPPVMAVGEVARPPVYSARPAYWGAIAIMCAIAVAVHPAGGWAVLILFPAFQLIATVITLVAISVSRRGGQVERMAHIKAITLRALAGTAIGGFVMVMVWAAVAK